MKTDLNYVVLLNDILNYKRPFPFYYYYYYYICTCVMYNYFPLF